MRRRRTAASAIPSGVSITVTVGLRQPIATHAPLTVMASLGLTTRRSRSAALPSPALAAFSKRRRPACAELPIGALLGCLSSLTLLNLISPVSGSCVGISTLAGFRPAPSRAPPCSPRTALSQASIARSLPAISFSITSKLAPSPVVSQFEVDYLDFSAAPLTILQARSSYTAGCRLSFATISAPSTA